MVSVPIGNLGDITLRALETLRLAEAIACEDTRTTRALLRRYGIDRPLLRYDEHVSDAVTPRLVERIAAGAALALVSDAGTPLVSDPGHRLVRAVGKAGLAVTAVPGASAVTAALTLSGLPTERFLFAGFPPSKETARRRFLAELAAVPATIVLFEAPHRLVGGLAAIAAAMPGREAAVVREITKLHEEVRRGMVEALAAHYAEAGPPKGEIAIVIGPPPAAAAEPADDLEARLRAALTGMGVKEAVAAVAGATGRPRREVYALALRLKTGADGDAER